MTGDLSRADTLEAQAEERLSRSDREWFIAVAIAFAVLLGLGGLAYRSLDRSADGLNRTSTVTSCAIGTALEALDALARDVIPPDQFDANPDLQDAFTDLALVVADLDVAQACADLDRPP